MGLDQQRLELGAAPAVAAGGERAQRVAVEALAPGDEPGAPRLAPFDEVLACHLERGLNGLRAAADEEHLVEVARRAVGQLFRQPFDRTVGEIAGMGEGDLLQLFGNRPLHPAVRVAQAGNRSAAAAVEIFPAVGIVDVDALAMGNRRHGARERAMENVGHGTGIRRAGLAIAVERTVERPAGCVHCAVHVQSPDAPAAKLPWDHTPISKNLQYIATPEEYFQYVVSNRPRRANLQACRPKGRDRRLGRTAAPRKSVLRFAAAKTALRRGRAGHGPGSTALP